MELQNEFTVPAPVSEVWKTLLDVERIAPCLPGATVDRHEGDEVAGRVNVKVGPITASYAGTARFVTKDESAHRFVLAGKRPGDPRQRHCAATVEARMSEQESGTHVTVGTSLEISGKQAQFGRGVMADVAAKLTDQFAACLAQRVREPAAADGHAPAQAPARPPRTPEKRRRLSRPRPRHRRHRGASISSAPSPGRWRSSSLRCWPAWRSGSSSAFSWVTAAASRSWSLLCPCQPPRAGARRYDRQLSRNAGGAAVQAILVEHFGGAEAMRAGELADAGTWHRCSTMER